MDGTKKMTVHAELMALCAEMHAAGMKLTYEAIRERRGGGSKRDISHALRSWHVQRARLLAATAPIPPDELNAVGAELVAKLWARVVEEFSQCLIEMQVDAHHGEEEVAHLHKLLGEQNDEIDRLKAEIIHLTNK